MGTTFSWIFEDPRRDEEISYDSMLERFRKVRDEIELKIMDGLEHPEHELKKLREERERDRRERLAVARRETDDRAHRLVSMPQDGQERPHLPAPSLATPVRG